MNTSETLPPRIAPMLPEHAGQVLAIYQAGIDEGDATFETAAPDWETFDAEKLPAHRMVALACRWIAPSRSAASARSSQVRYSMARSPPGRRLPPPSMDASSTRLEPLFPMPP